MNETLYVNVFSKIAWEFGLLNRKLAKAVANKFELQGPCPVEPVLEVQPAVFYLMQYLEEGCQANCAFCVQAISSKSRHRRSYLLNNQLLRFSIKTVTDFLKEKSPDFKRICIQTVYHKKSFKNLVKLVTELRMSSNLPISADCIPLSKDQIQTLKDIGLDMITINYELSTPELFHQIRGEGRNTPYRWEIVTRALDDALEIFKPPRVASHLLLGIGETDYEALRHYQYLCDKRIIPSLLSFKPLKDTDLADMKRISHARFHKLQLGADIIRKKQNTVDGMHFDETGALIDYGISKRMLHEIFFSGIPFINSGCPGCNRPNYTIHPGERHYTYPMKPSAKQLGMIARELNIG